MASSKGDDTDEDAEEQHSAEEEVEADLKEEEINEMEIEMLDLMNPTDDLND